MKTNPTHDNTSWGKIKAILLTFILSRLYLRMFGIKGSLCSFGQDIQTQNCYIYNVNEVILQILIKTQEYLFSELNKQAVLRRKLSVQNTV